MTLRTFDSVDRLEQAVLVLLAGRLARSAPGPRAVMLTGGRTPLGVYRALAGRGLKPAASMHVILSDERHVPADSPESNYGNLAALVRSLGLPPSRVLRVRSDLALEEAAADYDRALKAFVEGGGRIALGLLGLGADGHAASLFSPRDVERGAGRFAVAVPRRPGPDRVSVTRDLLIRVERVVFMVAGPDKAGAVERFMAGDRGLPATLAVEGAARVEVWYAPRANEG